jgi:hypothetical protein
LRRLFECECEEWSIRQAKAGEELDAEAVRLGNELLQAE